jgi:hypothetical protein
MKSSTTRASNDGLSGASQVCRRGRRASHREPAAHYAGSPSTGDTAWTGAIADAAADTDLLIAEAYYRDKNIPYHLQLADLNAHLDQLTARRVPSSPGTPWTRPAPAL